MIDIARYLFPFLILLTFQRGISSNDSLKIKKNIIGLDVSKRIYTTNELIKQNNSIVVGINYERIIFLSKKRLFISIGGGGEINNADLEFLTGNATYQGKIYRKYKSYGAYALLGVSKFYYINKNWDFITKVDLNYGFNNLYYYSSEIYSNDTLYFQSESKTPLRLNTLGRSLTDLISCKLMFGLQRKLPVGRSIGVSVGVKLTNSVHDKYGLANNIVEPYAKLIFIL